MIYCLEGIELGNNIFRCTKCVNNSHLNNSICECNSDSFDRYNEKQLCYKCDDRNYGNPGCEASEGCQYYIPNSGFPQPRNFRGCGKRIKNTFYPASAGRRNFLMRWPQPLSRSMTEQDAPSP